MPMLAPIRCSAPPIENGSASALMTLSATDSGSRSERICDRMISELVASEARQRVRLAHASLQTLGRLPQHLVARGMAAACR